MFRLCGKLILAAGLILVSHSNAELIDGEELVDPTRPFFFSESNPDEGMVELIRTVVPASFDISFIRASDTSPMAVINDQRVTIGDVIGGAQVVAIDRSGVTLLINDQERRISLYSTDVKAPSADH